MDLVLEGLNLQKKLKQLKQEIEERKYITLCQEQEQGVRLEFLKIQTIEQQEKLKYKTREFGLLCENERNKKRSIEQLDKQIWIKIKKIRELGRQEISQKKQLGEVKKKVHSQKKILESLTQKVTEINNEEEERRLKNVEDKERTLRIEIGQKETVERETTRKEFELELVKKSIAEGYSKLEKIQRLTKRVQYSRYLQQMVSMPAYHQSPPIHSNPPTPSFNPILSDSPVDVEHCVPPQPFIPNQSIQSGLLPRPSPTSLPPQPSQLVGQFLNQQKLQRQQIIAKSSSSLSESTTSCPVPVNPINIDIDQRSNSTNGSSVICYASSTSMLAPTVTPVTFTLLIPEIFTLPNSSTTTSNLILSATSTLPKSSATTSSSITTVASTSTKSSTSTSKLIPSATSTLLKTSAINSTTTSKLASSSRSILSKSSVTISPMTSTLAKSSTTTSELISAATSTLSKSSVTISPVTSTLAKSSTTTSKLISAATSILSKSSPPISAVASTLASSPTSTSSFANSSSPSIDLDKSDSKSTSIQKATNFANKSLSCNNNGTIETITIDDSDDDVEVELVNLDDYGAIEDIETSKSINQIQMKNYNSTNDELIEVNPIGGDDIVAHEANVAVEADVLENKNSNKLNNNKGIESNEESKQSLKEYCCRLKSQLALIHKLQTSQATSNKLNNTEQNGKVRSNIDVDINNSSTTTTSESSENNLARERENTKKQRRANETPEEREHRLRYLCERRKWILANETPEQRESRMKYNSERQKRRIANETPEQRERRRAKVRQYDIRRRSSQSNSNKNHIDGMSNSSFDVTDSDFDYDEQSSNQQSEMVEFKSTKQEISTSGNNNKVARTSLKRKAKDNVNYMVCENQ